MDLYWNMSCPLELYRHSQAFMASFDTNATTRSENTQRAQQSRQYSADQHHSLQRIFHALSQGAFDGRTIVFDGDSLTRQLFISLSCLVHSAGYI